MAELILTQGEADGLIAMRKRRIDDRIWQYPGLGGSVTVPLESVDGREDFLLDVYRARIDLLKGTYQNRARRVVVLAPLDFGGKPHRNPDGEEIARQTFTSTGRATATSGPIPCRRTVSRTYRMRG